MKLPIWLYIALTALLVIGVQQWRVHVSNQKVATFQSAVTAFQSAQQTNLSTIATLQRANDDWAGKCEANQPEARHEAELSVAGDIKRHAAADANIKTLHNEAEHDVSVKTWLEQPVPTGIARVLAKAGGTN